MITGDENIVDIDFTVFWRINDASAFLFNLQNRADGENGGGVGDARYRRADPTSKQTTGRKEIELQTQSELQGLMDEYNAGIEIAIQLLIDLPSQVIDAFNEVQRAKQDKDTAKKRPTPIAMTWCRWPVVRRPKLWKRPKPIAPRWSTGRPVTPTVSTRLSGLQIPKT